MAQANLHYEWFVVIKHKILLLMTITVSKLSKPQEMIRHANVHLQIRCYLKHS